MGGGLTEAEAAHREAMSLADQAMLARSAGDADAWRRLTLEALERERQAAELVGPTGLEPSRSVLWRSAASLALDAGLIDEARELIGWGLRGEPPADVAAELAELLEECERHEAGGGGGRLDGR